MPQARDIFSNATEEEQAYFDMIDAAQRDADPSKVISNGMPAHAVYILYTFLKNAEKAVRICTGRLARTFDGVLAYASPSLIASTKSFISKPGTKLSIIIRDDADVDVGQQLADHPLLAPLGGEINQGRVRVSKMQCDTEMDFDRHFIVMDDTALRIEFNTEKAEAFVTFGDSLFAGNLARLFDMLEERSAPLLPLPRVLA